MKLSVEEILKAVGGTLVSGDPKFIVQGVSTDTRTLQSKNLYVPLKGPKFDGHDFLQEAMRVGAAGALVSKQGAGKKSPSENFFVIQVSDTLKALGDLAHAWRKNFSIPLIGITGSSGKTSTKELIALCLAERGKVLKTEGNLNNLIGLPLTLFNLSIDHKYAVIEMGMNAFGEIARLTEIAVPTVGVITNVGQAHLEGVGGILGVAKAKGELFEGLASTATALVNIDDPYIAAMPTPGAKLIFGKKKSADIFCKDIRVDDEKMFVTIRDPKQETIFELPMVGEHHALNWLACYAVCFHLGISPLEAKSALTHYKPAKMRGEVLKLEKGIVVINDVYNANPDSMVAALQSAALQYPRRRKIAVLGDMLELGKEASLLHQKVGKQVRESGFEILLAFGSMSAEIQKGFAGEGGHEYIFSDIDSLNQKLSSILLPHDVVLVKGSRGSQMERVVNYALSLSLSAS